MIFTSARRGRGYSGAFIGALLKGWKRASVRAGAHTGSDRGLARVPDALHRDVYRFNNAPVPSPGANRFQLRGPRAAIVARRG